MRINAAPSPGRAGWTAELSSSNNAGSTERALASKFWLLMRRKCVGCRRGLVGLHAPCAVIMCHVAERCSRGRQCKDAPRELLFGERLCGEQFSLGEPKHDERSCSRARVGAESVGEVAGLRSPVLSKSPSDSVSSNSCNAAACRRRDGLIVCMRVLLGELSDSLHPLSDSLVKTTQSSLSSPEDSGPTNCNGGPLLLISAFAGESVLKRDAGLNNAIAPEQAYPGN